MEENVKTEAQELEAQEPEVVESQTLAEQPETAETAQQEQPQNTSDDNSKPGIGARIKEWFRKKIVTLKRKPQIIALLFLAISSVIYLIGLNTLSPGPYDDFPRTAPLGLCVMVNALFSILTLVLFLNAFPKRPKYYKLLKKKLSVNIIMLVLVFVFIGTMIAFDIVFYTKLCSCIAGSEHKFFESMEAAQSSGVYEKYLSPNLAELVANNKITFSADDYKPYLVGALELTIVHLVFLGISAFLTATVPLFKMLIMKIPTKKDIGGTQIKEAIDTEDE